MKFLSTFIDLLRDSRKYAAIRGRNWLSIFITLLTLYFKSKFTSNKTGLVSHRLAGFKVFAGDFPTLIALYREIFLEEIYRFSEASDAPLIVDCGANIGMSVLYFKTLYPESKIFAFEPNPSAYALLEKNVAVNQLEGVSLFHCAITDVDGLMDFYVPVRKASLNASSKPKNEGMRIEVEGKRLSGLLSAKTPDFIKIDVEGDELKIIKDLYESSLLKFVAELVIEFHPGEEKGSGEMEEFLSYFVPHFTYEQRLVFKESGSKDMVYYFRNKSSKFRSKGLVNVP